MGSITRWYCDFCDKELKEGRTHRYIDHVIAHISECHRVYFKQIQDEIMDLTEE